MKPDEISRPASSSTNGWHVHFLPAGLAVLHDMPDEQHGPQPPSTAARQAGGKGHEAEKQEAKDAKQKIQPIAT